MSYVANLAVVRARRLLARGDATLDELDDAIRAVLLSPISDEAREAFHTYLIGVAPQFNPSAAERMLALLSTVYSD